MSRLVKNLSLQKFQRSTLFQLPAIKLSSPASVNLGTENQDTITTFAGENVVITGGGGGLGRALAVKLGKLKATVVLWDSNQQALDETVKMIHMVGGRSFSYVCDLSRKDEIYKIAEKTKRDVGPITMVINNADKISVNRILDSSDQNVENAFAINVLAHFWTTKAFLPGMIKADRGHIVSISSMAGHMGINKLTDYCSTKAASIAFLMSLRTELERTGCKGVKTTLICPYFMKSVESKGDTQLRILSALKIENVADETIEALKKNKQIVFMPGWFKYALIPRWVTPFSVTSFLKKLLIKDTIESPKPASPVQVKNIIGFPEGAVNTPGVSDPGNLNKPAMSMAVSSEIPKILQEIPVTKMKEKKM